MASALLPRLRCQILSLFAVSLLLSTARAALSWQVMCRAMQLPEQYYQIFPQLAQYQMLEEMCVDNDGLRFNCNKMGAMCMQMPPSDLFYGDLIPLSLQDVCINNCWCQIVDDMGSGPNAGLWGALLGNTRTIQRKPQKEDSPDGVLSNEGSSDSSGSGSTPQSKQASCTTYMGHPHAPDCAKILQQLTAKGKSPVDLTIGEASATDGALPAPYTLNYGTCYMSLYAVSGSSSNVSSTLWSEVTSSVYAVSSQCSGHKNLGGNTTFTSKEDNSGWAVTIYGPTANFKKQYDTQYRCGNGNENTAQCPISVAATNPSLSDPTPAPQAPPASSAVAPLPPAQQASNQGGKTCYSQSDCDIETDSVCASRIDADWGTISSSWGTFTCTHVINALAALSVAKTYSTCRGRCLLESDGSLAVQEPYTVTIDGSNSSYTLSIPASPHNETRDAPAPSASAANAPVTGMNLNFTGLDSANFDGLACPCNCTYVSASCCLTSTVWEDPHNNLLSAAGGSQAAIPGCNRPAADSPKVISGVATVASETDKAAASTGIEFIRGGIPYSGRPVQFVPAPTP